jgi:hypothetical protein
VLYAAISSYLVSSNSVPPCSSKIDCTCSPKTAKFATGILDGGSRGVDSELDVAHVASFDTFNTSANVASSSDVSVKCLSRSSFNRSLALF